MISIIHKENTMKKRLLGIILILSLLLSGCGGQASESAPSTVETEEITVPTTVPVTEAPTEAPTEPPVALHSGLRSDGSFDEHTLFLGDSLTFLMITHYLDPNGYTGDAKYAVKAGVGTNAFFWNYMKMGYDPVMNCLYVPEFQDLTMAEAAASMGEDLHAVYIMLGTNYIKDGSYEDYVEICDYILETCPNATVHLQLVPYSPIILYEEVNDRIRTAFEHYQEQGEERVLLLDTFTAIGDNLISDRVHLNDQGRENWYQALLAHARDNDLPQ